MNEQLIYTLDDLPFAAQQFLNELGETRIVVFNGEMGVGKTTFIQILLKAMGIEELHGSPTYPIIHLYESPYFGEVAHLDVYRLADENEAIDIGVEELLYSGAYCFIEWGERIQRLLPTTYRSVDLTINEEGVRLLHWKDVIEN